MIGLFCRSDPKLPRSTLPTSPGASSRLGSVHAGRRCDRRRRWVAQQAGITPKGPQGTARSGHEAPSPCLSWTSDDDASLSSPLAAADAERPPSVLKSLD